MSTQPRRAAVERATRETKVSVSVDLDGTGKSLIATGIGFFDHMLDQLARHSLIDLTIRAEGDLYIDDHHTTEDVGITLGQALKAALGDKRGLARYGDATVPMDEALTRVALDLSNRPVLAWKVAFPASKIGTFDTELFREFFHALAQAGGITLHVETFAGENAHHIAESCFKALARALKTAVALDPRAADLVPSTKGTLGAA